VAAAIAVDQLHPPQPSGFTRRVRELVGSRPQMRTDFGTLGWAFRHGCRFGLVSHAVKIVHDGKPVKR